MSATGNGSDRDLEPTIFPNVGRNKSKGGWNYRVIHIKAIHPFTEEPYDYYEVHEVHYNEKGEPNGLTEKYTAPGGETIEEFLASWRLYQKSLLKPVLVWNDKTDEFEGEEKPVM